MFPRRSGSTLTAWRSAAYAANSGGVFFRSSADRARGIVTPSQKRGANSAASLPATSARDTATGAITAFGVGTSLTLDCSEFGLIFIEGIAIGRAALLVHSRHTKPSSIGTNDIA